MKVGSWTKIKEGFWFRPIFVACDTFEHNSLVVMVEYTERVNIYVPFQLLPSFINIVSHAQKMTALFSPAGLLRVDGLKKSPPSFFSHWRFVSLKLLRFHFFPLFFLKAKRD